MNCIPNATNSIIWTCSPLRRGEKRVICLKTMYDQKQLGKKNNMWEAARWRWCFWLFIIVSVIWGETREGVSRALPLIIPPCHLSLDLFTRKLYGICNVDNVTYFMQGLSLSNFERSQIWRFSHFCEVCLLVSLPCKYMKLQLYFRQN